MVKELLRVDLLAQEVATALAVGRSHAGGARPDLAYEAVAEAQTLGTVRNAVPDLHVRPSSISPVAKAAYWAVGAAAGVLPTRLSGAVVAGVQDGIVDTLNEQLREIRESGLAERGDVTRVRSIIRELRDRERAPEGAPQAPDVTDVRRLQELSPAEGVAAIAKFGTKFMLDVARKL